MSGLVQRAWRLYCIVTSIGVVTHELAHKRFAESRGLEIRDVTYFSLDSESLGSVTHEPPRSFHDVFFVAIAPFIMNTAFGFTGFLAAFTVLQYGSRVFPPSVRVVCGSVCAWVGVSVTMHAFPSRVDVGNITAVKRYLLSQYKPSVLSVLFRDVYTLSEVQSGVSVQAVCSAVTSRVGVARAVLTVVYPVVWVVGRAYQVVAFTVFHLIAVIVTPVTVLLVVCNETRRYGSQVVFTGLVAVGAWWCVEVVSNAVL